MKNFTIVLATSNPDKAERLKRMLPRNVGTVLTFSNLPTDLVTKITVSDAEEKTYATRQERAVAKVEKAAAGIAEYYPELIEKPGSKLLILGMDDVMYIPALDYELVDLRLPPELRDKQGRLIMPAVTERLSGIGVVEYYMELVRKLAPPAAPKVGYKFIEIQWRFSLAAVLIPDWKHPKVIADWSHKQFLRDQLAESLSLIDTGYMMDRIASSKPTGPVNAYRTHKIGVEQVPTAALRLIFSPKAAKIKL